MPQEGVSPRNGLHMWLLRSPAAHGHGQTHSCSTGLGCRARSLNGVLTCGAPLLAPPMPALFPYRAAAVLPQPEPAPRQQGGAVLWGGVPGYRPTALKAHPGAGESCSAHVSLVSWAAWGWSSSSGHWGVSFWYGCRGGRGFLPSLTHHFHSSVHVFLLWLVIVFNKNVFFRKVPPVPSPPGLSDGRGHGSPPLAVAEAGMC